MALDPLPESAPPVIVYQPDRSALRFDQIVLMQQELELAALKLFPAWLPGAEHIAGPQGSGVTAVRMMAADRAKARHQFGPFLADLAEAALRGSEAAAGSYAPALRSTCAAWAIAESFRRKSAALLIDVPDGITASGEARLTSAADWVAGQSGVAVWLTGVPLATVDKYKSVSLDLEPIVRERTGPLSPMPYSGSEQTSMSQTRSPVVQIPPLSGLPRADSAAECALEKALVKHGWSGGRCWNQTYQTGPLSRPFRLDLWWKKERCVIEVDGPEHHRPLKYAADRRRDVQLQLDGHAVLRYTNDQVLGDLDRVISEIGRLIRSRRPQHEEKVNA